MQKNRTTHSTTAKLAVAGLLTAAAVAGSLLSVPVAGSKCAPVQHMVKCICRSNTWTMVGSGDRILCELSEKSHGNWKPACFSGQYGRGIVLWNRLSFYKTAGCNMYRRSTWDRSTGRTCSLSGGKASNGA